MNVSAREAGDICMPVMDSEDVGELPVTFNPPLYLQRQIWVLGVLRRERVESVLDIGCGEGALLTCLTQPSWTVPPSTSLPATSPFVCGPSAESNADLYLKVVHGLDPSFPNLQLAIEGTAPSDPDKPPFTGYERWRRREARWMPLEVNIWEGGFETLNDCFEGNKIDAFVASEVIEHLSPELLPLFAPILLGYYRPRLLLLTTPNYTYNQRFMAPGKISPTGYPDPTARTNRVFRHPDHKFEWTTDEWTKYCMDAAKKFGYTVDVGGIGCAVEPDPWDREEKLGFASQFAAFRRLDAMKALGDNIGHALKSNPAMTQRHILRARHFHVPHPLSSDDLARSPIIEEIKQAVRDAMNSSRVGSMSFADLWNNGEVSLKCAGDIGALVRAFESEDTATREWLLKEEDMGWEANVLWKFFSYTPPAESDLPPNVHDRLEEDSWCEDASNELDLTDSTPVDEVITVPTDVDEQGVWGDEYKILSSQSGLWGWGADGINGWA